MSLYTYYTHVGKGNIKQTLQNFLENSERLYCVCKFKIPCIYSMITPEVIQKQLIQNHFDATSAHTLASLNKLCNSICFRVRTCAILFSFIAIHTTTIALYIEVIQ